MVKHRQELPKQAEVGAVFVEYVKNKINLWQQYMLLRKIARKDADFFARFVGDYCESDKELKIMMLRYVHKLKFKQIPENVNVEERQVYKLHQKVIDALLK